MKYFITLITLLFIISSLYAAPTKKYGKKISLKQVTKVSDILAAPEKFDGKKVLVEGTIVNVCKKRGCWMEIGSEKEFESIRFKVEDGVMVFPLDAKGKKTRAEGIVAVETYTKEELIEEGKKHAKESGEKFDEASITGPEINVKIMGEGAEIK
jgi:hypothetical protein